MEKKTLNQLVINNKLKLLNETFNRVSKHKVGKKIIKENNETLEKKSGM